MVAVNDGVITDDRRVEALGQLHRPARRLRQPLHLRRARRGRQGLPGPEGEGRRRAAVTSEPEGKDESSEPEGKDESSTPRTGRTPRTPASGVYAFPERSGARVGRIAGQRDRPNASGTSSARATRASRSTSASPSSIPTRPSCGRCEEGSQVLAGTVLGHIGETDELAPHVHFSIRPRAAARRRSTRSRSSTAGSCSRRPTSTAPWARTRSRTARRARGRCCCCPRSRRSARCSPIRGSRSTSAGARTSRPARSTSGSCDCCSTWPRSGFRTTVTSLKCGHWRLHLLRQRQPALDRERRRHRARSTGCRCSATRARARSPRR